MDKYIRIVFRIAFINLTIFLCCYLMACKHEPPQEKKTIILPNTPENVCRMWQTYLDKNEFSKAMLLGSPETKKWLKENQALFLEEEVLEPTQFITMLCKEAENRATCKYTIKEEEDIIEDFFTLVQINGQWLIHIEDTDSDDPNEKVFEELKKALDIQ